MPSSRPLPGAAAAIAAALALTAPCPAQILPGQAVATVAVGPTTGPVGEMDVIDFLARTATALTLPASLQSGVPNCVLMLPGGIVGYVATQGLSGTSVVPSDVYSITIAGSAVNATKLNTSTLPGYNAAQLALVGGDLWFTTADSSTTNGLYGGKLCRVSIAGGNHVEVEDLGARSDWGANHTANAVVTDGRYVFVAAWPSGLVYRHDTTQALPSVLLTTLPMSRQGTGTTAFYPLAAHIVVAGAYAGEVAFAGLYGDVCILDRGTGAVLAHYYDLTAPITGGSTSKNAAIQNPDSGDWVFGTRDGFLDALAPVGQGQRAQRIVAGVGSSATPTENSVNGLWMEQTATTGGYIGTGGGCAGSGGFTPTNQPRGLPARGASRFAFTVDSGTPGNLAILIFGTNGGPPFPIDLTAFGAPSCFLRNDIAVTVPKVLTGGGAGLGSGSIPVALPNQRGVIYTQWAVQDAVNSLGLVFSDGRQLTLP